MRPPVSVSRDRPSRCVPPPNVPAVLFNSVVVAISMRLAPSAEMPPPVPPASLFAIKELTEIILEPSASSTPPPRFVALLPANVVFALA